MTKTINIRFSWLGNSEQPCQLVSLHAGNGSFRHANARNFSYTPVFYRFLNR